MTEEIRYLGNFAIDDQTKEQCAALPILIEETRPAVMDGIYTDLLPEQVGFFKQQIDSVSFDHLPQQSCLYQIINQMPGRMLPWHIDKFESFRNSGGYTSVNTHLFFLSDWIPGQVFGSTNDTFVKWSAGDCVTWDYLAWHYLSNASLTPILLLQVLEGM